MTAKEYLNKTRAILQKAQELYELEAGDLRAEIAKENNGDHTIDYIRRVILPKEGEIRQNMANIQTEAERQLQELYREQIETLQKRDQLRGEDLNSEISLLTSGIKLTENDVQGIIDRNPNNRTVQRLAREYADSNGLKVKSMYQPALAAAPRFEEVKDAAIKMLGRIDQPDTFSLMYGAILGENGKANSLESWDEENSEEGKV